LKETVVASDFDFQGPGVFKPHPKKNWVNPDAKQVHWAGDERPRRGPSRPSGPGGPGGPSKERGGRSPLKLLACLVGLIILVAIIAALLFAFVID